MIHYVAVNHLGWLSEPGMIAEIWQPFIIGRADKLHGLLTEQGVNHVDLPLRKAGSVAVDQIAQGVCGNFLNACFHGSQSMGVSSSIPTV